MGTSVDRAVGSGTRRRAPRRHQHVIGGTSALAFTLAQVAPMIFISTAFLLRGPELAMLELGGVPLVGLLAASSVVIPLASQAFAGVAYATVATIDRRRFAAIADGFLRSLPRSVAIGVPLAVLLGAAVAAALQLEAAGIAAYAGYLGANLLFALALTFAYVLSSARIIVVSWAVFALALAVAPALWWAPGVLGALVGFAAAIIVARSRDTATPVASWGSSTAGAVRATVGGLPLWTLPLFVFLAEPATTEVGVLFIGMLPVLLLYQVYFSLVARPLWVDLDVYRRRLERTPVGEGVDMGSSLRAAARRGAWVLALGLAIGGAALSILVAAGFGDPALLGPLFAATAAGMVLIVEVTRYAMMSGDAALYWTGPLGPIAFAAGWILGGATVGLVAFAVACAVAAVVVAVRNAFVWRDAAYHLFWRRAFEA